MDSVNLFGFKSTSYNIWPILVVNYNLPHSMAIKKGHLMLSLLISWRHKVKKVDVYLEYLIDELEALWRGIEVTDLSKPPSTRGFFLKAVLMWMMHDFPSYEACSGKYSYLLIIMFTYNMLV